ncbi:hypothetical protein EPIR_0425 [Erwinia piriflorinigrans CFBP 5888]|uniref:HTH luxR-type domain-containing protein n=2 Tax=Erwinia piriflorinigrans TaxID=665097 RepID=V5Z3A2_9GAMM|nr:hypothetical protein EPIR_0425 [Erwinia piriflorinigrans CFBP 5888]
MNGMPTISKQTHTTRRALVLDNNSYFLDAVEKWAGLNNIIVSATSHSDDFFYRLAMNDDIDIVFVSYNPVWTRTLHLLDKLQRFYPDIRTVVVVDFPHTPSVILMRSFGVNIIITKQDILSCLPKTITLAPSSLYLSPSIAGQVDGEHLEFKNRLTHEGVTLTQMERTVLAELSGEKTIKLIARERGCSAKTVSQHKQNALCKMGFRKLKEVFSINKKINMAGLVYLLATILFCQPYLDILKFSF